MVSRFPKHLSLKRTPHKPKFIQLKALGQNVIADGKATYTISVHVTDSNGNGVKDELVNFEATNTTIKKTAKTNEQGIAEVDISSTTVGTSTVTATVNGAKETVDIAFVAGTVTVNKNGKDGEFAVVHNIGVDTKAKEIMVGGTVEFTVKLTDALGNTLKGINKNDVTAHFASSPITLSDWKDNDNGSYTATVTMKEPGIGTFDLKINEIIGKTEDIKINKASKIKRVRAIVKKGTQRQIKGKNISEATLVLNDNDGNAVPNQKITFEFSEIPDLASQQSSMNLMANVPSVRFINSDDDGIYTTTTNAKGEVTIKVASRHEGTVTVKATPENGDPIDCDFYYTADPSQVRIAAALAENTASKQGQIIVVLMDNQGLQITGQAAKLNAAVAGEDPTINGFEEQHPNKGVYTAHLKDKKNNSKIVVTYSGTNKQTKEVKWVPRMSYEYVE